MLRVGYCEVNDLQLSPSSRTAVSQVHDIINRGGMLGFAIASTPLYQIFFSPSVTGKPAETMITIREYDWEIFGEAMSSVSKISKDRVLQIAEPLTWTTSGSEQKFWRCISEAAL
ncbi:hypothetical protein [Vibrio sp. 10N]|uniref:hypothetical protein n=1 Tax=Vibrio sp. 10N TaxID=3058938 RepID=UPI002813264A|nr:hypothetical protein VB10N_03480 [Vibrio sp. 10N]